MIARAIGLALAVISTFTAPVLAQEEQNPMKDVTAFAAVDGIVLASSSPANPFTIRFVGGDPKQTKAADGNFWIPTQERMIQFMLVPIANVLPKADPLPGEREILSAHAAWECKDHNEKLHLRQKVEPEFLEGGGRTWAHWTYNLTTVGKRLKKESPDQAQVKTQHALTTVMGRNILMVISTTFTGQKESDTMLEMFRAAKTLAVSPRPLSPSQITELCSQKQP